MIFRKKSERPSTSTREGSRSSSANRRRTYRVRSKGTPSIRATLDQVSGEPIEGDCIDLSIGGAWIKFEANRVPQLRRDVSVVLRLRADSHGDSIRATSRVVSMMPIEKPWVRVGFQFTNRIELYAQLDAFYAGLFNRRRHARIRPPGELDIRVKLSCNTSEIRARIVDLSESGLGVVAPTARSKDLVEGSEVDVAFRLPKERVEIACRSSVQARTNLTEGCLLGIEFDPYGGIGEHAEAIAKFVEKRLAAYEAWHAKLAERTWSRRAS